MSRIVQWERLEQAQQLGEQGGQRSGDKEDESLRQLGLWGCPGGAGER